MFHGLINDPYLNALHAVADAVHAAGALQEHQEKMAKLAQGAKGYFVHYTNSKVLPTTLINKCLFVNCGPAMRAAERLNAKRGAKVFTVTAAYYYYTGMQLVVKKNVQGGKLFLEREDTPYYCSPSSETYHSA